MNKLLIAEDIHKEYKSKSGNVLAVNGVSYEFEEKQCYAIIGKSGSGKSTLLHILGCLGRPDSGRVLFQGEDIYHWKNEQQAIFRRRHMGFIFQQFNLVPDMTVKQNIALPIRLDHRKMDEEYYQLIMDKLSLNDKTNKYPSELSGGEQQRVAIARSLIAKPQIVYADEPTGNLDKKTSEETIELLYQSAREFGQTIILVTHDLDIARDANKVLKIEDGRLVDI